MASFGEWLGQLGYGTRVDSETGETVAVGNEDYTRVQGHQLEKLQEAHTRYTNPAAYGSQGYVPTLDSGLADQSSNTLDRGSDPYHVNVGGVEWARTGESLAGLNDPQLAQAMAQWKAANPGQQTEQFDPKLGWLTNASLDNVLGPIRGQQNEANDTPGWKYMAALAAMAAGGYGLSEAGLAAGAVEGGLGAAEAAGGAGLIEGATTAGLAEGAAAGASEGFLAPLGQTFTDVAGPLGSNVAATAPFTGAPLAAPYAVAPELGVFGTAANTASAAPGLIEQGIDYAKKAPGKLFDYAKDHPQVVITAAGLLAGSTAPGEEQQRPLVPTAPPPPGMTANYSGLNTGLRPSGAVLKYRDGTPVYGPTGIINAATRRA